MVSQRKAGVLLGYANIAVKNLVNLVYTPLLLSFVGQADYGVFQTANSFVFTLTLLSFGFSDAYTRFFTQESVKGNEAGIRKLNGMYLLLHMGACIVAVVLGFAFSTQTDVLFSGGFTASQAQLAGRLMRVMTLNVAVTLLSTVFDAYILVHERFAFQQQRQMVASLIMPLIAYALLNLGSGVLGVALSQLAVSVVLLVVNARFALGCLSMRFDFRRLDGGLFKAVAAFSGWIFANQVCDMVNQTVPNVLLGATAGAAVTAVFAVAVNIRQVFYSLSLAMSNVFGPLVNRIVASSDDNAELTHLMTRVGRWQMLLFCFVYGGFVVLGRFFIERWAGADFSQAYWLVLAMALPVAVPLCQNTGIAIQRAKNKHRARSVAYLCMAAASVACTWFAAPHLGCWAAAIAYIISIALGNGVFMNWYYHSRIGLDMCVFWRSVAPVVGIGTLATATGLIGTFFTPVASWPGFFAWGVVYSVVYAALAWHLILMPEEKKSLKAKLFEGGR